MLASGRCRPRAASRHCASRTRLQRLNEGDTSLIEFGSSLALNASNCHVPRPIHWVRCAARKIVLCALSLVSAVLATGCGATGPKFTSIERPSAGSSAIYVYRPTRFAAGGFSPLLIVDGQIVGRFPNGSFVRREIPAGAHRIELRRPSEAYGKFYTRVHEIATETGSATFIRYDIEHQGPGTDIGFVQMTPGGALLPMFIPVIDHSLVTVEPDVAEVELKETRAIE